jgi:hypothetical protein
LGYGGQPLYQIAVSLSLAGNIISEKAKNIGFKSFEIITDPRPDGLSFYFQVNQLIEKSFVLHSKYFLR